MAVNTSERQILRKAVSAKNSARERQLPRTTMTTDDTTRREQMSEVMTSNCSRSQMDLAKQANKYLLEHMDRHVTIRELSSRLHVSQTQLKNSFRSYFGNSVYKYARSRKLEKAADELAGGELSIMEIAGMCGYENCSKFAAAFKGEYGVSPSDYRRQNKAACVE